MEKITERQVIGTFYKALEEYTGAGWVGSVANYFTSDQDKEDYAWLGMAPALQRWVGGRGAKGFTENNIEIENLHYEATVEILLRDLRRDKTGQVMTRVREMARRTNEHWADLLTTLIINGPSTTCYDGQYFFDTDHSEGDSGTQSNSISVDISGLPVDNHGDITNPSIAEMQLAIAKGVEAIVGFLDNQGKPMNSGASSFIVMVPVSLMNTAMQAVATPAQVSESQTVLQALKGAFSITAVVNPFLGTNWSEQFAVFRTDSEVKAFIRQEETAVQLKTKWEDSEFCFDNDAVQAGFDTWRNVGYGYWQNACLVTMI